MQGKRKHRAGKRRVGTWGLGCCPCSSLPTPPCLLSLPQPLPPLPLSGPLPLLHRQNRSRAGDGPRANDQSGVEAASACCLPDDTPASSRCLVSISPLPSPPGPVVREVGWSGNSPGPRAAARHTICAPTLPRGETDSVRNAANLSVSLLSAVPCVHFARRTALTK